MNKVKKQIQQIANEVVQNTPLSIVGHIFDVDAFNMCCDVIIHNPHGPGEKIVYNVPTQIGSGGVSQAGPFIGDRVILAFLKGNLQNGTITSILDRNHKIATREQRLKHSRKGAYLTDEICKRTYWPIGGN